MNKRTVISLAQVIFFVTVLFLVPKGVPAQGQDAREAEQWEGGQGIKWIPRLSFPPADPDRQGGYLPLYDRDISFEYLKSKFYLSWKHGLEWTRNNSDFYLRLGGRIFLEYANYFEDKNDLGNYDFGVRNFMLEVDGRFSEKWPFRLSFGGLAIGGRIVASDGYLDDIYLSYVGERTVWIFGQQQEPFSLEQMTSNLATTFMERSLPNGLVPGASVGISFLTTRNRWILSAGLFSGNIANEKEVSDQGFSFTGRGIFRPERHDGWLYHLGASFSYRPIPGGNSIYFRNGPESGLSSVRYVNTGDIQESQYLTRVGLEGAFAKGPLSLQAEFLGAFVDRTSGFENLAFYGWYTYVSWFVTGESRRYLQREGLFAYPKVKSKWGAVELAVRYSTLNLNDGPITGGQERNLTFGINWYIRPRVRLMANYILVYCDENANDHGAILGGDRPQIFMTRFHFQF
jgi:phosphate-selective porin OprO/OprP